MAQVQIVSKINKGIVEVSDELAKKLLANKSEWQKVTTNRKAQASDKEATA